MAEVGLTVTAKDAASAVLDKIGVNGKKSMDVLKSASVGAASGLEKMFHVTTILNQGLELFKKAVETVRYLLVDNMVAMVEYRGEADAISKEFRQMADDAAYTRAVIYDLLTPVVLGLGDAFNNASNSLIDFINTNRKLIATNITTFLADAARILVEGVAGGVLIASKAVSGLIEAWHLLSAVVNTAVSSMLGGISSILSGLAEFTEWADDPKLAQTFRDTADTVKGLGDVFSESADKSIEKMEAQVKKQADFEDALRRFREVAVDFVGEAQVAILDRIANGWTKVKRHTQEAQTATVEQLETTKKSFDELERSMRYQETLIRGIGAEWTEFSVAMATGSENVLVAMGKATIGSVRTIIMAMAAEAAARAFAAHQSVPFVGIALGTAAAGAAFATVEAMLGDLPKAAAGGEILTGMPGIDNQVILGQKGEGVFTPGQTEAIKRLAESAERGQVGGQTNITIAPRIDALDISAVETKKRVLMELANEMEQMVSDNLMLRNLQRS